MSTLVNALIAGRHQRLLRGALWSALYAVLLAIGFGFIHWQVASHIGRDQNAELGRISAIRGDAIDALRMLQQDATAPALLAGLPGADAAGGVPSRRLERIPLCARRSRRVQHQPAEVRHAGAARGTRHRRHHVAGSEPAPRSRSGTARDAPAASGRSPRSVRSRSPSRPTPATRTNCHGCIRSSLRSAGRARFGTSPEIVAFTSGSPARRRRRC